MFKRWKWRQVNKERSFLLLSDYQDSDARKKNKKVWPIILLRKKGSSWAIDGKNQVSFYGKLSVSISRKNSTWNFWTGRVSMHVGLTTSRRFFIENQSKNLPSFVWQKNDFRHQRKSILIVHFYVAADTPCFLLFKKTVLTSIEKYVKKNQILRGFELAQSLVSSVRAEITSKYFQYLFVRWLRSSTIFVFLYYFCLFKLFIYQILTFDKDKDLARK